MPKGAQGTGRRPGASRRDECASRSPGIGVTAPQSGHSRATRTFGRMGAELKLRDPEVGGTFDCRAGHVGRHAIDDY